MTSNKQNLISEIEKLKQERNAVILVHNYQLPEVYEIADYLGDSLELARQAAATDHDLIVFCGVYFMAETAKILSPDKTVLLPDEKAGCPMADMLKAEDVLRMKAQYPRAAVACYVNTNADVKAVSDICVTSGNALKVINSLSEDRVIFVPDRNLGDYIASSTDKEIICFDGYCPIHQDFNLETLKETIDQHPSAEVIAHPECPSTIRELATHICSTSGMITTARESSADEFIIATEVGMIERLKIEVPDKTFYPVEADRICEDMKLTTLESVYTALTKNQYEIHVDENTANKALGCLERMLAVK